MSQDADIVRELVEKIQQFFSHQLDSNSQLTEANKESLAVASECIEQAYNIQRQPASSCLLDVYKNHKQQQQQPQQGNPSSAGANLPPGADPVQFIQNLANNIMSQATARLQTNFDNETPNSSSTSQPQGQTASAPSGPAKVRKHASEAEKLAAESFKNQGNEYMKQDKYKEAFDSYSQAINIDNNNAIYYSNRAAASSKLGDHNAALRDCQEAVEIDSSYSKAYGRMGLAYASLNNHQKAKDAYVKAVELDPSNESYRNNLKIAEEQLAGGNPTTNPADPTANLGDAFASALGGLAQGNNMMSMIRTMMGNPEVMQMAMRSLQDPRMQSLFGMVNPGGAPPNYQQPPPSHSWKQNPDEL